MVHIVLVEPEIPQNCGNIARTCAATGCDLHLIRPLGFDISDRAVKRAGLDYWHLVSVYDYENLEDFFRRRPEAAEDLWLATTKAPQDYCQARFREGCWLFFGKETAGLPEAFRLAHYDRCIRRLLLGVTLYIATATAMVGPLAFLGLIIANLSRQFLRTYRHSQLITGSVLFGMAVLIGGQLLVERVFVYSVPVSVFITVGGGVYFLYLLLTQRKA